MADETFDTSLLRWIAAELYFSLGLQASREMFGKGYFSLGPGEKVAVDDAVGASVRGNYRAMNLDFLTGQDQQRTPTSKPPVGFQNQNPKA